MSGFGLGVGTSAEEAVAAAAGAALQQKKHCNPASTVAGRSISAGEESRRFAGLQAAAASVDDTLFVTRTAPTKTFVTEIALQLPPSVNQCVCITGKATPS